MRFSADELVRVLGARLDDPHRLTSERGWIAKGVHLDSRSIGAGQLFVAIVAERDGHDFVAAAEAGGAAAALVQRSVERNAGGPRLPAFVVDSTTRALAALGAAARSRIPGPVVGITGSVGKTTTKDILAELLAATGVVGWSVESFNNELGVPLTLANTPDGANTCVVEMGARGAGHIAELCDVARPTVGVITAIGAAHTERFGSLDDVAAAKGELFAALPSDGIAVVNIDDHRILDQVSRTSAVTVSVSVLDPEADVAAADIRLDERLRPSFTLRRGGVDLGEVRLCVRGRHNVANATLAAAVALAVGVGADDVLAALSRATVSSHRMSVVTGRGGATIIDDTYNANPSSVGAALDALSALPVRRKVAVLGLMAELDDPERRHRQVADDAARRGIEVIAVGTDLYGVAATDGIESAATHLGELDGDVAVLVKGSRVAGLERLVARLVQ